ncbi:hypothetical protein ACFSJY_18600 [Thalassotalea euphylliae]|uniref:hypothetical protein n=1 Tax=Thalassotalea euphylliae TaxID=1655234 RepID=UPI0036322E42
MFTTSKMATAATILTLTLSACSNTGASHRPIVDGGDLANYENDLLACQEVAKQRGYINADTQTDMAIGATAGALAGATESGEDLLAGAVIGAAIGAAGGSYKAKDERKFIVIKCMQNRGYNVVEPTTSH